MRIESTGFEGLKILEPSVFKDERGVFFESYNQSQFAQNGLDYTWVQDNQSSSVHGVIRGLHFQKPPHAQAKLVRVLSGMILDVVVDLRSGEPTFGKVFAIQLSAENKLQLLIPRGFAHGFSVLSETAEVMYKCDGFYHKESEQGIIYNDADLSINWQINSEEAIVSAKDLILPSFAGLDTGF
ncbi:MAG: dTDP-4-dehydrorhamnose 3,5-epimerase [Bacteroidota bacterium]|jgi:dTDP-4-dehydrorhamnose 3,5-epimerase